MLLDPRIIFLDNYYSILEFNCFTSIILWVDGDDLYWIIYSISLFVHLSKAYYIRTLSREYALKNEENEI